MNSCNITKEQLTSTYSENNLSMKAVADIFGVGVGSIHRAIKKYGIESKPVRWNGTWNKGKTYLEDNRILAKNNHPRYIDGRTYPSDYRHARRVYLPDKCVECGKEASILHHVNMIKGDNSETNLLPMCVGCHSVYHNKIRDSYKNMLRSRGIEVK